jgi:hypothetical protein
MRPRVKQKRIPPVGDTGSHHRRIDSNDKTLDSRTRSQVDFKPCEAGLEHESCTACTLSKRPGRLRAWAEDDDGAKPPA